MRKTQKTTFILFTYSHLNIRLWKLWVFSSIRRVEITTYSNKNMGAAYGQIWSSQFGTISLIHGISLIRPGVFRLVF